MFLKWNSFWGACSGKLVGLPLILCYKNRKKTCVTSCKSLVFDLTVVVNDLFVPTLSPTGFNHR